MELRHLRYFVAVAEMENVSRAALKLHVSQPALSRQIRDLEDEIGFSLFERTAKSVRLTDAGRAFLDNARALLQNADDAKRARQIARLEHQRHSRRDTRWPASTRIDCLSFTLPVFEILDGRLR